MKYYNYLLILCITILLLALISFGITAANRYYEIYYNYIVQLSLIHIGYIIIGMIIGLEHIVKHYISSGTWHVDKLRIALITLPLFAFYLIIIFNLCGIYTNFHSIINDLFKQVVGILIGYSFIISFSKKE